MARTKKGHGLWLIVGAIALGGAILLFYHPASDAHKHSKGSHH